MNSKKEASGGAALLVFFGVGVGVLLLMKKARAATTSGEGAAALNSTWDTGSVERSRPAPAKVSGESVGLSYDPFNVIVGTPWDVAGEVRIPQAGEAQGAPARGGAGGVVGGAEISVGLDAWQAAFLAGQMALGNPWDPNTKYTMKAGEWVPVY